MCYSKEPFHLETDCVTTIKKKKGNKNGQHKKYEYSWFFAILIEGHFVQKVVMAPNYLYSTRRAFVEVFPLKRKTKKKVKEVSCIRYENRNTG